MELAHDHANKQNPKRHRNNRCFPPQRSCSGFRLPRPSDVSLVLSASPDHFKNTQPHRQRCTPLLQLLLLLACVEHHTASGVPTYYSYWMLLPPLLLLLACFLLACVEDHTAITGTHLLTDHTHSCHLVCKLMPQHRPLTRESATGLKLFTLLGIP